MAGQLQFLGAQDTVTGSRTLVKQGGRTILVDCGLFQGVKEVRERNWRPFPVPVGEIDAILLTHAHLDHSGYLPRLVKQGYRGPVYCSEGTADLCQILLMDAAYLEEETAKYANKTKYSNHDPALPLFTKADAEQALKLLEPVPRGDWLELPRAGTVRFLRAGHIIGASFLQLAIENANGNRSLTFSGDVGHGRSYILKGPVSLPETDLLVMESTYGDRLHPRIDILDAMAKVVNRTLSRGGVLVIPAFAVGRAQEVTYILRKLENQGKIPKCPVLLDSPMAASAADICCKHPEDHILESAFLGTGDAFKPAYYEVVASADESMLACMRDGPMTVISASGMLNGGRILHHLKARLPKEENTVLFTGFQAEGTKGRYLQELAADSKTLRIHHTDVEVAAEIETMDALSAHADYQDLLDWLARCPVPPGKIILNHGAGDVQNQFAALLKERTSIPTITAYKNRVVTF